MKIFTNNKNSKGFTIIELLTVISVIAVLIGLMVPALSKVKKIAKDVQQRAQFHSISVALDIFQNEMDEYPSSKSYDASNNRDYSVTGAHILAEALVGRDLQGFDPFSAYNPNVDDYANNNESAAYARGTPFSDISLARRKGPYLNLDRGGAYDLGVIYGNNLPNTLYADPSPGAVGSKPLPVLTDIYNLKKTTMDYWNPNTNQTETASIKVGSPVLYFKANSAAQKIRDIYDFTDNSAIFGLAPLKMANSNEIPTRTQSTCFHWGTPNLTVAESEDNFYEKIRNPQVATVERPYNVDSYILLSAGSDGIYGTSDDIWNFSN